jgi:hypothetical protein
VTYRVSVLELYVLLEGEVMPNTPRGPSKDALIVGDEEGLGEVGVGVGVVVGDGDDVGIGEAVGKEFSP